MAMSIDKAWREGSRVELRNGEIIQLLPLLDTDDAPCIIHRDEGARSDTTAVDKVVGGDTAHRLLFGLCLDGTNE